MNRADQDACRAWQLLMKFFFAQRAHLPSSRRRVRSLPGPVPRAAPDRARAAAAHEPARRDAVLRRVERHRAGRSAGIPGSRAAPAVAADRRVKVLQLTPTGARLRAQLLRQMTGGSLPLSRLSLDQQRTLVKILEALVDET